MDHEQSQVLPAMAAIDHLGFSLLEWPTAAKMMSNGLQNR